MPYLTEMSGLLSTFTLPTTAWPSYSLANSSTMGPTMRHGPHHSAQKSTNTGLSDCSTTSSKLLSVISNAIILNRYRCFRSEEHTSELQSLMSISYAVFCLKKKKKHK